MATTELTVWMYDVPVATIDLGLHPHRNRLRLYYRDEAFQSFDRGTPLLSLQLPLTADRYSNALTRAFLDGLLPEEDVRRVLAEDLELRATDTFGLIAALGRDCAGAVVIQPADQQPPTAPTTASAEPISEDELESLVANLRSAPLGVNDRVRLSLAGVQEKLLLTRTPNGTWGRPVEGTPSTHIIKPELRDYPNTVENEAFCMRLARHLGLPVTKIETTTIGKRNVLIVERYDRNVDDDGRIERIHQEDFCQAMGVPPASKYEESGGPSLKTIARTLDVHDPDSVDVLLRAIVLNIVIGNGDAHAKNFSLLHERSGAIRFAPLYDLLSTLYYQQNRLSMYVDAVQRTDRVTKDRIVNEAALWGMPRDHAETIVVDVLERFPGAVDAARDETAIVPDDLIRVITGQLARIS